MNETRERFLKAILERLPVDKIAEIHFFPAIRQGQMETGVAVIAVGPEPDSPVAGRHVVFSAAYRWTRKGPDRGKWELDVTPEADAPLSTVDAVVRGVQERAGEAIEPQRLTAHELRSLLAEPAWQSNP
jgi:hypothetical protein